MVNIVFKYLLIKIQRETNALLVFIYKKHLLGFLVVFAGIELLQQSLVCHQIILNFMNDIKLIYILQAIL
jgi:hypothetical protein